jgi:hypothetical protein
VGSLSAITAKLVPKIYVSKVQILSFPGILKHFFAIWSPPHAGQPGESGIFGACAQIP